MAKNRLREYVRLILEGDDGWGEDAPLPAGTRLLMPDGDRTKELVVKTVVRVLNSFLDRVQDAAGNMHVPPPEERGFKLDLSELDFDTLMADERLAGVVQELVYAVVGTFDYVAESEEED